MRGAREGGRCGLGEGEFGEVWLEVWILKHETRLFRSLAADPGDLARDGPLTARDEQHPSCLIVGSHLT